MAISIDGGIGTNQYPLQKEPEKVVQSFKNNTELENYIKEYPEYVPTVQEKMIINTIEKANQKTSENNTQFEFSVHERTKQIVIKVIDTNTKEVVKEIPSEKILDMVANMCELAGIFVDEKR